MSSNAGPSTDPMTGQVQLDDSARADSLEDDALPTPENMDTKDPNEVVDLEQVLETFKAQLDLQQKQLKLLQGLSKGDGTQVPQTEKAKSEEVVTPSSVKFTDADFARALQWEEKYSPNSKEIWELGKGLLDYCKSQRKLWFSDPSLDQKALERLSNTLLQKWPQSLGSVTESENYWDLRDQDEKLQPESELLITSTKYSYREAGGMASHIARTKKPTDLHFNGFVELRLNRPVPSGRLIELVPNVTYHCLTLTCIALILIHQIRISATATGNNRLLHVIRISRMIDFYLCPWQLERKFWGRAPYKFEYEHMFYVRFFARGYLGNQGAKTGFSSLHGAGFDSRLSPAREKGQFFKGTKAFLIEKRVLIQVISQHGTKSPCFNVVQLGGGESYVAGGDLQQDITNFGGQLVAMHVFIQVLAKELIIVCTDWAKVLDGMDEKLGATVTDLLDDQIGHQLMFDDKQFERSKLYFTSQQLCRVFKKYIEGTLLDLQQSQENFFWKWNGHLQETNVEHDLKVLKVHWTEAMAKPRTMFESLLTRVKDKQEEVESLRDGLFNATSVREASRGTELAQISFQQNQYLFVFTIMTVIYLPLGFVTSIFGMHLFDTTDPNVVDARPKFYTTLVVLSVSTYVAAGLAFWLVRNNKKGSGDDAAPRKKEEKTVVNPIKVKQGDGKTKGGIFASMRKRNGTGNGKGKGKEINSNVEVV